MMEKRFNSSGKIEKLAADQEQPQPEVEAEEAPVEEVEPPKPPKPLKHPFDVGTKFMFNEQTWMVKRAWVDNGAQFRHVQSSTSGEENFVQLHTLQKDSQSDEFIFLEATKMELLMLKHQKR